MSLTDFNSRKSVEWGVNTEGWECVKLDTLPKDTEFKLQGLIPSKKDGKSGGLFFADGKLVTVPMRYREIILSILEDDDAIAEIKSGRASFKWNSVPTDKGNDAQIIEFLTR